MQAAIGPWKPSRFLALALCAALCVAAAVAGRSAAAAAADAESGCAAPTRTDCAALPMIQDGAAEEQLAAKYAPIVYLRERSDPCSREAYRPMPVEVVLGNPRVTLVRTEEEGRVVEPGPAAADLFRSRADPRAYIDLPGNPNAAGCTYVRDFAVFGADAPAVTYAHIAREQGYLALQYWLYYYFNDWNNQHESDWEMIQLLFRADSAAEALEQDPLRVSYAQHSGGETAEWDDPKLEKEGNHPVVYVSAGSHASYFQPRIYLGLGENGSGLGCDDASGRARRVPLVARLVPETVSGEDDPFAWSAFGGRWGQREPGQNNGPRGPNLTKRWTTPVTDFDEHIKDYNVTVPTGTTLGPNAIEVFCEAVSLSGQVVDLYYRSPWAVVLTGGVLMLAIGVVLAGSTRATFFSALADPANEGEGTRAAPGGPIARESAAVLYRRHLGVFLAIGAVYIPIGIVSAWLNAYLEFTVVGAVLALSLFSGLPFLVTIVVVNSAVAAALGDLEAGRRPSVVGAYRAVWTHGRTLLWARLKVLAVTSLLSLTVVGIPFAIDRTVRWLFVEQAIVLDRADARTAQAVSAGAVRGHWWRTALTALLLGIVAAFTGPVLAVVVLVLLKVSADSANLFSSLIFALVLPLVFIALAQFYRGLTARRPAADR